MIGASLTLVGSGCATLSLQTSGQALLGIWYSGAAAADTLQPGDNVILRTSDGRYVSYFRVCKDKQQSELIETGRWSLQGNIETMITETVDGVPADSNDEYYRETYEYDMLVGSELTYSSVRVGLVFHERRVDDQTKIPDNVCSK